MNSTQRLQLDGDELRARRAFFEITDDDLARLAALRPLAERHAHDMIEDLYALILGHDETRAMFLDEAQVRRVKQLQRDYFLGLFAGRCDVAYVEDRVRVGATHERIGMGLKWYVGAYSRYLRLLFDRLQHDLPPDELSPSFHAVEKLIAFDMSIAIDVYVAANLDTMARHNAAIRELSTPVIRIQDRVLLLPLVGTVDSHRAQQIMETMLVRVVDEQAKVVIIDIAGVAVVDTQVADHLLKTTAAVRLLGARTILTGISPLVARTIVQLGVDISTMHTRSRLADGLELAMSFVGLRIAPSEPAGPAPAGGPR